MNDLLLLLAGRDEELFVRRALDFRVPEALRERLDEAMDRLSQQNCRRLWVYRKRLEVLTSGEEALTVAPASIPLTQTASTVTPQVPHQPPPSAPPLPSLASLKRQLQPRAQPLPRKVRKMILRYQAQVLEQISAPLRPLVEAGLQLNLFHERTAAAVRTAFRRVTGRFPEDTV
ncbi:hypothetical protein F8S09_15105 [Deinococcus sp. SDU3-2]|uniref:Uncharacterized protein n=1 Tax=Deinococcus terrestris TaxID=2651870 RepID=A0A7X1NY91_9DEIO|nr:hypothetical protein [Deinococcus terrestris]MPY67987.1 hypothetical protein [Deinococcus terrestris]